MGSWGFGARDRGSEELMVFFCFWVFLIFFRVTKFKFFNIFNIFFNVLIESGPRLKPRQHLTEELES